MLVNKDPLDMLLPQRHIKSHVQLILDIDDAMLYIHQVYDATVLLCVNKQQWREGPHCSYTLSENG